MGDMDKQLQETVQVLIQQERDDEVINRDEVKDLIQIYVDLGKEGDQKPIRKDDRFYWEGTINLGYYERQFESTFLYLTQQQFLAKANQWNSSANCEQYLRKVYDAIAKEEINADYWLQPTTKPKMLEIVIRELVSNMATTVADKEAGIIDFFK